MKKFLSLFFAFAVLAVALFCLPEASPPDMRTAAGDVAFAFYETPAAAPEREENSVTAEKVFSPAGDEARSVPAGPYADPAVGTVNRKSLNPTKVFGSLKAFLNTKPPGKNTVDARAAAFYDFQILAFSGFSFDNQARGKI